LGAVCGTTTLTIANLRMRRVFAVTMICNSMFFIHFIHIINDGWSLKDGGR
jgi:hypothetical protein